MAWAAGPTHVPSPAKPYLRLKVDHGLVVGAAREAIDHFRSHDQDQVPLEILDEAVGDVPLQHGRKDPANAGVDANAAFFPQGQPPRFVRDQ